MKVKFTKQFDWPAEPGVTWAYREGDEPSVHQELKADEPSITREAAKAALEGGYAKEVAATAPKADDKKA